MDKSKVPGTNGLRSELRCRMYLVNLQLTAFGSLVLVWDQLMETNARLPNAANYRPTR